MKVAIISPSLNVSDNVSGIANHTKLLLLNNKAVEYQHIAVGRKDSDKRNLKWIINQFSIIFNFWKKINDVDIVHLNTPLAPYSLIINYLLCLAAEIQSKKIIVHFRGGELSLRTNINYSSNLIIRHFIKKSNAIIFQGKKEKEFYKNHFDTSHTQLFVLPNSVSIPDLSNYNVKEKFESKIIHFVYIGRIDFAKGLKEISEALYYFDKLNFHLHIIGDGESKNIYKKMLKEKIDGKYTFHGTKTISEIYNLIKKLHIFLLASDCEGLPKALLEAMANFLVPIVTPVGSIPEVVNKESGYFVNKKDSDSLKLAIEEALKSNSKLYKKSLVARSIIEDRFSIDKYCCELNNIYTKISP